ncbi:EcoRII N-terminal effector-binding domain-containing protein [Micrococcaceae bacterium Sec5.1]
MSETRQVAKTLTANDLGLTGSHQSGIAIPKDPAILAFFPPLDAGLYNPDCSLTVSTPQTGEYWELRFIYYNNKTHGQGTRDEYRLTGTTKLLRQMSASVGDQVTFRRNKLGDIEAEVQAGTPRSSSRAGERVLGNGWTLTMTDEED